MNRGKEDHGHLEFAQKVLIAVGLTVTVVVALLIARIVMQLLLLVFAGILLAIFLQGLAGLVSRTTVLPNGWSLLIVLLFLAAVIIVATLLLWPHVASQMNQLGEQHPSLLACAHSADDRCAPDRADS